MVWVRKSQPDCLTVPVCLMRVGLLMLSHLLCFEPGQVPPCHISSPVIPREYDWHTGTEVTSGGCLWTHIYPLQAMHKRAETIMVKIMVSLPLRWNCGQSNFLWLSLLIFHHWCLDIGTHFYAVTVLFIDVQYGYC